MSRLQGTYPVNEAVYVSNSAPVNPYEKQRLRKIKYSKDKKQRESHQLLPEKRTHPQGMP